MDLLETFFSDDILKYIIDNGVDKTLNRSLLRKYCTPEARVDLLDRILAGEYHIAPPRVVQIPKGNGKIREIYVNRQIDRLVLAGVNRAYYHLYGHLLSTACKAYRENISCAKVVREVASKPIRGYKLDLSKYFDSVPIEVIDKALDELDTGSPLDEIVREYYHDNRVYINGRLVERYKSLAQGCAVAAFLCNYILRDLDNEMMELCEYYCRYSDDMLLLGDNTDNALEVLKTRLAELGLSLNPAKVEKVDSFTEFSFLGYGIKGSVITTSQKNFIEKKREVKHACRMVETDRKLTREQKLVKAVRAVHKIFFSVSNPFYGWLYGEAIAINSYTRLAELDKYCKEHIRAAVTGSWNYTSNTHKVTEEMLRNAGYVSLVQMAKLAAIDRDAFQQEHLLHIQQNAARTFRRTDEPSGNTDAGGIL